MRNRMIAGLSTRPILGGYDRMIVSTPLGGEILIRGRRKEADQAPCEEVAEKKA